MYVCICHQVSEKEIEDALSRGQRSKDILKRLNVGKSCGTCLNDAVKDIELRWRSSRDSSNNQKKNS